MAQSLETIIILNDAIRFLDKRVPGLALVGLFVRAQRKYNYNSMLIAQEIARRFPRKRKPRL